MKDQIRKHRKYSTFVEGGFPNVAYEAKFSVKELPKVREYCRGRSGVYIIVVKKTGQCYVGSGQVTELKGRRNQTNNVYDRIVSHLNQQSGRTSEKLSEAIQKVGLDEIEIIIVKTYGALEEGKSAVELEAQLIRELGATLQTQEMSWSRINREGHSEDTKRGLSITASASKERQEEAQNMGATSGTSVKAIDEEGQEVKVWPSKKSASEELGMSLKNLTVVIKEGVPIRYQGKSLVLKEGLLAASALAKAGGIQVKVTSDEGVKVYPSIGMAAQDLGVHPYLLSDKLLKAKRSNKWVVEMVGKKIEYANPDLERQSPSVGRVFVHPCDEKNQKMSNVIMVFDTAVAAAKGLKKGASTINRHLKSGTPMQVLINGEYKNVVVVRRGTYSIPDDWE